MVVVDKDVCIAKIMWNNDMNANLFKNVGLRIENVRIVEIGNRRKTDVIDLEAGEDMIDLEAGDASGNIAY
eukprot:7377217-Heterocapsa_arctica.AAC.1